jgi:hypothetical protein
MRIENIGGYFKKFLCIAVVASLFSSSTAVATPGQSEESLPKIDQKEESLPDGLGIIRTFTVKYPTANQGCVWFLHCMTLYTEIQRDELAMCAIPHYLDASGGEHDATLEINQYGSGELVVSGNGKVALKNAGTTRQGLVLDSTHGGEMSISVLIQSREALKPVAFARVECMLLPVSAVSELRSVSTNAELNMLLLPVTQKTREDWCGKGLFERPAVLGTTRTDRERQNPQLIQREVECQDCGGQEIVFDVNCPITGDGRVWCVAAMLTYFPKEWMNAEPVFRDGRGTTIGARWKISGFGRRIVDVDGIETQPFVDSENELTVLVLPTNQSCTVTVSVCPNHAASMSAVKDMRVSCMSLPVSSINAIRGNYEPGGMIQLLSKGTQKMEIWWPHGGYRDVICTPAS